jgi:hypothetical protein
VIEVIQKCFYSPKFKKEVYSPKFKKSFEFTQIKKEFLFCQYIFKGFDIVFNLRNELTLITGFT